MTESQSGAAHKKAPSGDATNSDATSRLSAAVTQDISMMTEDGRGSRHRSQWRPPTAGGTASVTDPGPGARPRMGKKSAWAIGAVIAVAVLSVALSATARLSLSSSKTPITMAGAASSASPRGSAPGADAGNVAPLASKSAASHKAASTPSAAPTAATTTAPAASSPTPQPTTATTSAAAPTTASVPEPVSWWTLGDRTGTTAADSMGAHPGTAANINWCIPQYGDCAAFNGTDSDIVTSGPVLDTGPGSSFTVSAVVDLTAIAANGAFETVVSQDGTNNSGFYLQYSGADQRWAFARVVSDTAAAAGIRALSTSGPTLNTWTHLVGVFDASDDQLRLYVNGVLQGTATDTTPFAANGPLAIGRGQSSGKPTDWFTGATGEIQVWNVALTSTQVTKIQN